MDEDDFPRTPAGGFNQIAWLAGRVDDADRRLRKLEGLLAEHLGRCGDGGTFQSVEDSVKTLKLDMDTQKAFRNKVITYASVGIPVAALLATVIAHGIERLLGW